MVNAKGVAFKVNKQTPISQPPLQAYGLVLNCRKPGGKRAAKEQQKEAQSRYVPFTNVEGNLKRKRGEEEDIGPDGTSTFSVYEANSSRTSPEAPALVHRWQPPKPPRIRKPKVPSKGVDLDCWFTILSFSDPAQLLVMREKIPSCYYFLRDNPMLWKLSRDYHYGGDLPEPPSEINEYQYANLRHHHGCMNCKVPNTRKTYWAFLRRWCKTCLNLKTQKEHEALAEFRKEHREDTIMLHKCLPSGIFDSWGNFVGVGPATTHALKTVYLKDDVDKLVAEYRDLKARNEDPDAWAAELAAWFKPKADRVDERKAFAHKMEIWEEMMRNDRSYDYSAKKAKRKAFFQQKASELSPAISVREMELCSSYKRAVAIPKDPNNTSWLQLKPKLEKEAAELKAKDDAEERLQAPSLSGTSTPTSVMEPQQPYRMPMNGYNMAMGFYPGPSQSHMHQGGPPPSQSQNHMHQSLPPPQNYAHSMHQPLNHLHNRGHPGLPPPHSHMF